MKNASVLILASGKGERYGKQKQFIKINGQVLLSRTVDTWISFFPNISILVTVPKEKVNLVKVKFANYPQVLIIEGGASRLESTQKGLDYLYKNSLQQEYIYIHDAVRPIFTKKLCLALYKKIKFNSYQGVVPYLPINDSIIFFKDKNTKAKSKYLNRNNLAILQTPHIYVFNDLRKHLLKEKREDMENAQLVEKNKGKIGYVLGVRENIKLTHPVDLDLIKKLLK